MNRLLKYSQALGQNGLGLLDAVMASAILGLVLLALSSAQTFFIQQQANLLRRMAANNIAGGFISQMQNQSHHFPAAATSTGDVATYIVCVGRDGLPIANSGGEMGAQLVVEQLNHQEPTDRCMKNPAAMSGYEIHFVRTLENPDVGRVHILGFSPGGALTVGDRLIRYQLDVSLPSEL